MTDTEARIVTIVVRRYAAGKVYGSAIGESAFAEQAKVALSRSIRMEPQFHAAGFVALMREQGVPEPVIMQYLTSVQATDEAWLQDVHPT